MTSLPIFTEAGFHGTSIESTSNDPGHSKNLLTKHLIGLLVRRLVLACCICVSCMPSISRAANTFAPTGSLATGRTYHTATLLPNGKVLVAGGDGISGLPTNATLYDPATGNWSVTGSLATARYMHTGTLLPNGKVLVAGGYGSSGLLASSELYDPATGVWSTTGSLATARYNQVATLLPDGRVLVAGGTNGSNSLASAEIYDPATGTWSVTGSLSTARNVQTATLLPNGKVLVAGGYGSSGLLASAEIYDPATGTWSVTGSLFTARNVQTATLLPNGKVLVAGGYNGSTDLASAEIYDPATGTWSITGSLGTARRSHTATMLANGKVLVAGGYGSSGLLASSELYDPATGTWSVTGSLATARYAHTATLLPNGKVLVAGGAYLASAELYDPTPPSSLINARYLHSSTLLTNGKVLVAGGYNGTYYVATAELYDPATGTWAATGALANARYTHTTTLLPNGKVLVAGGWNESILASSELYDPATGTWAVTGSLVTARRSHTATMLANGKVLVAGGYNGSTYYASCELYDPATGVWSATGSLGTARYNQTSTLLPDGRVLVTGGLNGSTYLASAEIYNTATGTWSSAGTLAATRYLHSATLLANGKVLVAGGWNGTTTPTGCELYNPATNTWSSTGSLATGRYRQTASLLPNGKVFVTGGLGSSNLLASTELYDPVAGTWSTAGPLVSARNSHTSTILANGKVLVAGGYIGNATAITSVQLYDFANGGGSSTGSFTTARYDHTSTQLPNGKVLVAGGLGSVGLTSAELYDTATGSWSATGSLASVRYGHTATLLTNGKVLVAGGWNGTTAVASAELYDPSTGTWTTTGSLSTAREWHTATLLNDGRLLVAGGDNAGGKVASVEIYNPSTGTWSATASLAIARTYHTAALLQNGKVLVTGGNGTTSLASSELYDPVTATWSATGSLITPRELHTTTLLPNGKVLVAGGYSTSGGGFLYSAEIYDPSEGVWRVTGSLATSRRFHESALLPNGKVLVACGQSAGSSPTATMEIYDPASGLWSSGGNLSNARYEFTANLLTNGKVLVTGGYNTNLVATSELYDIGLGFSASSQPVISSASLDASGRLVLTGNGFRGVSGASGGNGTQDSPSDYPVVQLRRLDNEQCVFLQSDPGSSFSATSFTSTAVPAFPGYAFVTVFTNGIPSQSALVSYAIPAAIASQPASPTISAGATTTLNVTVTGTGPFTYQWYQGNSGITTNPVGTNSASFTTPALNATTSYWVKVSNPANLSGVNSNTAIVTVIVPDIALEAPTGTAVSNGTGTLNYGSLDLGQTKDLACTLRNTGNADLSGIALTLIGGDPSTFTLVSPPPSVLAAGASASFTVRFAPTSSGAKSTTLSIASNDPDENPFTLTLTGTGIVTDTSPPQLVGWSFTNDPLYASGGYFPTQGIQVHITDASGFSSGGIMFVPPGAPPSWVNFDSTQRISGSAQDGSYLVPLSIPANEGSVGTWSIAFFSVTDSAGNAGTLYSGSFPSGSPPSFQAVGDFAAPVIESLSISPSMVNVQEGPATCLIEMHIVDAGFGFLGAWLSFQEGNWGSYHSISVSAANRISGTAQDGVYRVGLTIPQHAMGGMWYLRMGGTNDQAGNMQNYSDGMGGMPFPYGTPTGVQIDDPADIDVSGPAGTMGFGNGAVSAGQVVVGQSTMLPIQIRSTSTQNALMVSTPTLEGPDASQFSIVLPPPGFLPVPLNAGQMADFSIVFSPTSSGAKSATLRIYSNDPNESPYTITLSGSGTSAGESWRQQYFGTTENSGTAADLADPDGDGLANLLERAFNLNPTQAGVPILVPGSGTSGLPNIRSLGSGASRHLQIQYLRLKGSTNPGITYTPQLTSDLTAPWQDFTGSETVESIDAEWERVTVEDTATSQPKRFGRVRVTTSP